VRVRKTCLRRLCEVVIWEEDRGRRVTQQSYLVAWLVGDDARVHFALNTRAATAFFGAQFGLVSRRERLELSGDTAMVLHAFQLVQVLSRSWVLFTVWTVDALV
jgi:hypothetical protein